MRRPAQLLAIPALALAAWAQDISQLPPSEQQAASTASGQAATIQGCLSGSEGSFVLTQDNTNTAYKLADADDQLKRHVGHEIAVTGQMLNAAATPAPSNKDQSTGEEPNNNAPGAAAHDRSRAADSVANVVGKNALKVSHIEMIADKCTSSPKGSATSPPSSK